MPLILLSSWGYFTIQFNQLSFDRLLLSSKIYFLLTLAVLEMEKWKDMNWQFRLTEKMKPFYLFSILTRLHIPLETFCFVFPLLKMKYVLVKIANPSTFEVSLLVRQYFKNLLTLKTCNLFGKYNFICAILFHTFIYFLFFNIMCFKPTN